MQKRKAVKVTFESGCSIITEINGTEQTIREYYAIGKVFNLGNVNDRLEKVVSVKFLAEGNE